ncbi:hypothetical protein GFS24_14580 [Chitinophaga sp. SYP-B3965]|uniref:hypothetical protein n=1 Tax=Chitinophaga sp. SYP-B3965 TaxID=2663120 RepID=UPI001299E9DA|nr:hypothetical protein [Chitinophaga sp. SYP-B3965]MRG46346.1 hypothetical protein [Chitinophaga sp. SYP-B3965]
MKNIFVVGCLLLMACGGGNKPNTTDSLKTDSPHVVTPTTNAPIHFRQINGYFVKNTLNQKDSIACWVIQSQPIFDNIFGAAKTMNNTVDTINFDREVLLAATLPASFERRTLGLTNYKLDQSVLHVQLSVNGGKKESYSSTAAWLGTVDAIPGLKEIKFYNGDLLIATIPLLK